MPKVVNPDGTEREISMEEFLEAMQGASEMRLERIHTNADGEEVNRVEIPINEDGSFNPFAGLFGGLFDEEELSLEELLEEAEDGDPDAMEQLALRYLNGDDEVEQDPEKAVHWFEKLAEMDNASAQFNLGLLYSKGFGVERSFEKAGYWMEQAAKNGDDDAPALAEQFKSLRATYEKAAAGDAQAQAELAGSYMAMAGSLDQAGPGSDYEESLKWALKAVDQGNAHGMWILALAYEHGRGVARSKAKAVELYKQGAQLGSADCMQSLGCCYINGDGIKENKKQAFELFKCAAEQGNSLAMRDLGRCYQFGHGVDDDMKLAIHWYEKALEGLDDDELRRKVALFKMLDLTNEDKQEKEPEPSQPEGYEDALIKMAGEESAPSEPRFVENFDENLVWNLKEGYKAVCERDEDGQMVYAIAYGLSKDEEGKNQAEFVCRISKRDDIAISDENINLQGNFRAIVRGSLNDHQLMFLTMKLLVLIFVIEHKEHVYLLNYNKLMAEEPDEERLDYIAHHMNEIIASMQIAGDRADMAPISAKMLAEILNGQPVSEASNKAQEEQRKKAEAEEQRKKKEAEEQRKKKKAEAQRKKKEENAKNKEKNKVQQEKAAYCREYTEWSQKCAEIPRLRQEEVDKVILPEKAARMEKMEAKCAAAKKEAAERKETLIQKKAQAEAELSGLGAFKFSEKSALRKTIKGLDAEITAAETALQSAEQRYRQEETELRNWIEIKTKELTEKAEKKYPMPGRPLKPFFINDSGKVTNARMLENEQICRDILYALDPNERYTIGGIFEILNGLLPSDTTPQRLSACVSELVDAGRLSRIVGKREVYVQINEDGEKPDPDWYNIDA